MHEVNLVVVVVAIILSQTRSFEEKLATVCLDNTFGPLRLLWVKCVR